VAQLLLLNSTVIFLKGERVISAWGECRYILPYQGAFSNFPIQGCFLQFLYSMKKSQKIHQQKQIHLKNEKISRAFKIKIKKFSFVTKGNFPGKNS
jgi:hypothetical protein